MTEAAGMRVGGPAGAGIWRAGAVAAAAAVAVNLGLWIIGRAVADDLTVTQAEKSQDVPFIAVVFATLLNMLLGTLVLWLLSRFDRGVTIWTVLAMVVGLGSIVSPWMAGDNTATKVILSLMHVAALAVALVVLRPAAARR
jgi:hypothetical protein